MANINVNNNLIGIMYHNSKDTCHILYVRVLGSGYLQILLKKPNIWKPFMSKGPLNNAQLKLHVMRVQETCPLKHVLITLVQRLAIH